MELLTPPAAFLRILWLPTGAGGVYPLHALACLQTSGPAASSCSSCYRAVRRLAGAPTRPSWSESKQVQSPAQRRTGQSLHAARRMLARQVHRLWPEGRCLQPCGAAMSAAGVAQGVTGCGQAGALVAAVPGAVLGPMRAWRFCWLLVCLCMELCGVVRCLLVLCARRQVQLLW